MPWDYHFTLRMTDFFI